jgi:hypothetical protein
MIRWKHARRDLLKALGLGAAGLPLLRAGRARAEDTGRGLKNLICVHAIHGYRMSNWKPAPGALRDQTLPSSTSPLEPHKADLLFATDLTQPAGVSAGTADRAFGTVFWGLPGTGGPYKEPTGKTLDQGVASAAQQPYTRASLALGVQLDLPPFATFDPGGRYGFWSGAGQPIMPLLDPRAAFQLLFGPDQGDLAAVNRLRFQRRSILDYVGGSLQRFSSRVGTEDQEAIARHLEAIRDIEKNLDRVNTAACNSAPPAADLTDHAQYANILQAHLDLAVAALSCGVTRVATMQLSDATGTSINFGAFVPGVPQMGTGYKSAYRNWADLGNNPVLGGVDHKSIVDRWWMARLAALIEKMKSVPDAAGGSLFDHSAILWANPVDDGAAKNASKKPWLVAAPARGPLRTGQSAATAGTPSSGVLAALSVALDAPQHPFGAVTPGLLV